MRLLMFGRTGQVARAVLDRAGLGAVTALGRDEADLSDPAAAAAAARARLAGGGWDAVINAAAYTAVDRAESEPELAMTINARAPGALAAAAAETGTPFLHLSTDYVFDGTGDAPRDEDAPTAPLNVYGATKLAGERAVRDAGGPHAILRVSWVFSAHGGNFVKTMRRLGRERDALSVVDDQIGGPTPASAIADALLAVARAFAAGRGRTGLFHYAGAPATSWAGFAEAVFAGTGDATTVRRIATTEFPTPARRPLNSRLDCGRIREAYGLGQPDWRPALDETLKALEEEAA
jgi:dTDP-4-dehydrorhamnose reductase